MRTAIRKMGNSCGVIIPKAMLTELNLGAGDALELKLVDGKMVMERPPRHPREGWAEDARRIAEAGDDVAVWPEFANEGEDELVW